MLARVATQLLFVYGSLKRGELHHDQLRGAPFVGVARTAAGYELDRVGGYWAMFESPGSGVPGVSGVVEGELFEVDAALLEALDAFEGDAYRRATVRLEPRPGPVGSSPGGQEREEIRFALAYLKRTR